MFNGQRTAKGPMETGPTWNWEDWQGDGLHGWQVMSMYLKYPKSDKGALKDPSKVI